MKKRILSMALVLLMVLAIVPAAFAAEVKTTDGLVEFIPPIPYYETVYTTYVVEKGDKIAGIAKKFGSTEEFIKTANKAYFDDLDARNKANKTNVFVEAGVELVVKAEDKAFDMYYRVQKGDALKVIAFNYYGNSDTATIDKIKAANKEYFEDLDARNKENKTSVQIEAGVDIVLPGDGMMNPITVSEDLYYYVAGIYVVKSGDTLADIAAKYYGDSKRWTKLYEANKDKIELKGLASPMIYVNQWIVVPE